MLGGRQYLLDSSSDLFSSMPTLLNYALLSSPDMFNLRKRLSRSSSPDEGIDEVGKPWLSVLNRSPSNRSSPSNSSASPNMTPKRPTRSFSSSPPNAYMSVGQPMRLMAVRSMSSSPATGTLPIGSDSSMSIVSANQIEVSQSAN